MKTLMLKDGDLVVGAVGHETISGPSMVAQDLRGALIEPLGNDRFHPGYGSTIDSFIGQSQSEEVLFEVEQEVLRVTNNYSAVQEDFIRRAAWENRPSRNTNEVFGRVDSIKFNPEPTRLGVNIQIKTVDGSSFVVDTMTGGA